MTTEPPKSNTKEWRITRDVRMAWQLGREPAAIVPLLRRWLVRLWASRGGGFYGLGYVGTFVALEIKSLSGDLVSVSGVLAQAFQYVIRFSVESLLNVIYAVLWPVRLFEWLGNQWGLVVLVAGYGAYEVAIRPVVEARFPEIKDAVAELKRRKQEKKERKRAKRTDGR